MFVKNLLDRADTTRGGRPDILHKSMALKVPLISLAPGEAKPPHRGKEGVFVVLEGSGVATIGDDELEVSEGSFWSVSKGEIRGVRAVDEDLIVMASASLA